MARRLTQHRWNYSRIPPMNACLSARSNGVDLDSNLFRQLIVRARPARSIPLTISFVIDLAGLLRKPLWRLFWPGRFPESYAFSRPYESALQTFAYSVAQRTRLNRRAATIGTAT